MRRAAERRGSPDVHRQRECVRFVADWRGWRRMAHGGNAPPPGHLPEKAPRTPFSSTTVRSSGFDGRTGMLMSSSISSASGRRRAARTALAAGLVAALAAAGTSFAARRRRPAAPRRTGQVHRRQARFGRRRAARQGQGRRRQERHDDGRHRPRQHRAGRRPAGRRHGASVGRTYDKLGYVRATVPTAPGRRGHRGGRRSSLGPRRSTSPGDQARRPDAVRGPGRPAPGGGATGSYPGPGKNTPAKNPYQPAFETGAVDFVKHAPEGRRPRASPSASWTPASTSATRRCRRPPPASARSSTG